MRSIEIIRAIEARGGHVRVGEGGKIGVTPASALTDELRAEIRAHHDGIAALLNIRAAFPDARVIDTTALPPRCTEDFPLIRRLLRKTWGTAQAEPATTTTAPGNVVALRPTPPRGWDAADWRSRFDERAGVLEFHGGMARADAEARAFVEIAVEWCTAHHEVDALPSTEAEPIAIAALAQLGIFDPRTSGEALAA